MGKRKATSPLSTPAQITGFGAILLFLGLVLLNPEWSVIPLALFLLLCFSAPFFPGFGFFLSITSRGKTGQKVVALTFDDGPSPISTPPLLRALSKHAVKAAFFVKGENALKYPEIIQEILAEGHTIGNHTFHHDPFLMLKPYMTIHREIESLQKLLEPFGIRSWAFRPPVGITNPKLGKILQELSMYCVTFNCRAFDGEKGKARGLAKKILKKVKPDAIILLHDVMPRQETSLHLWLTEMDLLITGLKEKGLNIVPLSHLTGRPVHELVKESEEMPVYDKECFYE